LNTLLSNKPNCPLKTLIIPAEKIKSAGQRKKKKLFIGATGFQQKSSKVLRAETTTVPDTSTTKERNAAL